MMTSNRCSKAYRCSSAASARAKTGAKTYRINTPSALWNKQES
jgi:hypothetical protein